MMGYTALAEAQGLADPIPVTIRGEHVDKRPKLPVLPRVAPDGVDVATVGEGGWLFTGNRPANRRMRPEVVIGRQNSKAYRSLTPRHVDVLQVMADTGGSNLEIARMLQLSEQTIKTHLARVFKLLGARDRAHAVAIGLRDGWIV